MSETVTVRRTVRYRGRVQGVGFRQTTCETAARFPVTGTVENLPDGRVLLVAEGLKSDVAEFLAAVQSELGRFIAGVDEEAGASTGEFVGFSIRR
ncbi:MAG: acylphosphatase [Pirellula sp.]|nr:acylphosphatase [Pirellula sp.]